MSQCVANQQLPPGAVSMFGSGPNPFAAAIKKQRPDSEVRHYIEHNSVYNYMYYLYFFEKACISIVEISQKQFPNLLPKTIV